MQKLILCLLLTLFLSNAWAQSDSLRRWYSINDRLMVKKFYREHIPLDGDSVSMIPFRVGEKFGFVDKKDGSWRIEPRFSQVFAVYPEGAIVQMNAEHELYGVISPKADTIVPPYFRNLFKEGDLFHGMIRIIADTTLSDYHETAILNMYFDTEGNLLFRQNSHDHGGFHHQDTLAWFRYGRQYFVYGKSGVLHKNFKGSIENRLIGISDDLLIYRRYGDNFRDTWYEARDLEDSLHMRVELDGYGGIQGMYRLGENLIGFYDEDGDCYFTDAAGKHKNYEMEYLSFDLRAHPADPLQGETFAVRNRDQGRAGVINRQGDTIIPFDYRYIGDFVNGYALFMDTAQGYHKGYGIMDTVGKHVLTLPPPRDKHFLRAYPFGTWRLSEGKLLFAADRIFQEEDEQGNIRRFVYQDSVYFGYLNLSGDTVLTLSPAYHQAGDFQEGLAPVVTIDSMAHLGFVDTSGVLVIPLEYELAVAGAYPIPYLVVPSFQGGYAYLKAFKGYIDRKGKRYFSGKRLQDHYDFSH
ncbi:MAG: WG repeat-containing protein [Bacteroidota bacterium]